MQLFVESKKLVKTALGQIMLILRTVIVHSDSSIQYWISQTFLSYHIKFGFGILEPAGFHLVISIFENIKLLNEWRINGHNGVYVDMKVDGAGQ